MNVNMQRYMQIQVWCIIILFSLICVQLLTLVLIETSSPLSWCSQAKLCCILESRSAGFENHSGWTVDGSTPLRKALE